MDHGEPELRAAAVSQSGRGAWQCPVASAATAKLWGRGRGWGGRTPLTLPPRRPALPRRSPRGLGLAVLLASRWGHHRHSGLLEGLTSGQALVSGRRRPPPLSCPHPHLLLPFLGAILPNMRQPMSPGRSLCSPRGLSHC